MAADFLSQFAWPRPPLTCHVHYLRIFQAPRGRQHSLTSTVTFLPAIRL